MTANRAMLCAAVAALVPAAAPAAVPKANCDNLDRAETGLQGETTAAEVSSGTNKTAVTCNTQLVGQYQGEGASWQLTAWKNCAYFDQRKGTNLAHPGTVVVDVSDPTHPVATDYLADIAMLDPWESLKVNAARQLLGGDQGTSGAAGPGFSIYDISGDCRHPVLKSTINLPDSKGHTGQWAPDGNTYYVTTVHQTAASLVAVDTKDPANPQEIIAYTPPSSVNPVFHDLEISKDGNTAYVAVAGGAFGLGANGLVILDVSDVQARRANPQVRVISQLAWDDGSVIAQNALPVTIAGKPYVIFTDEGGVASFAGSCQAGKSGHGFPRIIDVSDPKNPKTVANIMLEVAEPTNCQQSISLKMTSGATQGFGYSCHYCNVDDTDNATLLACNCFAAGLRLFDIRDPLNPKEIGYFKPPAQGTKALPGSQYASGQAATFSRPIDWASSKPSFPKDRGMTSGDIWTTSQDNGFMVVHHSHLTSGCNNAGATFGAVALLALMPLVHRLRRRR